MGVDGFELAYDRFGTGPAVVLLHGWPGDRTDYRDLVPLLPGCTVVVPDLRGFGDSDKHEADPAEQYSGPAQARGVVRAYLRHFWNHWSGPDFTVDEAALDHLVAVYSPPGAFSASVQWYRAGRGTTAMATETAPAREDRIGTPTVVVWPEHVPLFPLEWSDRIDEFFAAARLRPVTGAGHFAPLEYPGVIAEEVRAFLA